MARQCGNTVGPCGQEWRPLIPQSDQENPLGE